ncbi:Adenylate and Guanylate cyclase catalytic domain containing protein [Trichomonas vaginalis G3]|uniref:Adenylate and Guanylate cyclase catalytic domain containing protein n=1 Tax=Trichomonas vaginalis (strain ATCC PRA-98 / G3) TaxID=412133 RepID=A2G2M4_TRIV3|nr:guanylate cyclase protein [Trichomonas vaginalis G3]EAX88598.1 Adenylate and Guanylate cyclase catalytic domain containing protein [Trichomonas vaginalis G3]KAI5494833.1 guanylate cyclase protein [Trichomonas vaginalis G3]|eukprot:XP_001301528.1 Adenylate and Guanylate cyclase catalytic domain containing protein [Trichomonas vaginalis G3]
MNDVQSYASEESSVFTAASITRYKDLIDIPISTTIKENLSSLFNFLDIYGPKIALFHTIVSFLRLFQLIGCSFMTSDADVVDLSTKTYWLMNVMSVLFHVMPVSVRKNNEYIVLYLVNIILLVFLGYLLFMAFQYKKTSVVSKTATNILTVFMSFVPFWFLPIAVQFSGEILSALISKLYKIEAKMIIPLVLTVANIFAYTWIIISCYTKSLAFRVISFQTVEGSSQNKLFITTLFVTFMTSLTSYLSRYPSLVFMVLAMACYLYNCTTVFNCGTFIKPMDQTLILGGSILGCLVCGASLYPILDEYEWNDYYFAVFFGVAVLVFYFSDLFIKKRIQRNLLLLDEFEMSQDFDVIKSKGKFRQIVGTGFRFNHSVCLDFTIFKAAVEKWSDDLNMWYLYAKFAAIYPEMNSQLMFIANNMRSTRSNHEQIGYYITNIGQITKTRELCFTTEIKQKISKLSKNFDKSKNRLRYIWDLVLQGNLAEMDKAVKQAHESIKRFEIEVNQLTMLYPNNKYVIRQYVKFLAELKVDFANAKVWKDNVKFLNSGICVNKDILHELGHIAFPAIPDTIASSFTQNKQNETPNDTLTYGYDDFEQDEVDLQQMEIVKTLIMKHKVPALQFMKYSELFLLIGMTIIPFLLIVIFYGSFTNELVEPLNFLYGISYIRNLVNILPAFIGKYLVEELDDPKNPSQKLMEKIFLRENFPLHAYGGYQEPKDIVQYLCAQVPSTTQKLTKLRSYKTGNSIIEEVRNKIFAATLPFNLYKNSIDVIQSKTSMVQLIYMIATHCTKVIDLGYVDITVAAGMDAVTSRSNDVTTTRVAGEAMDLLVTHIRKMNNRNQKLYLGLMLGLIALVLVIIPIIYRIQSSMLKRNKEELYSVFGYLPKTVISNISSSFMKSKDESSISKSRTMELNKQEEGIIKLFSTISDGSSSGSIEVYNIFCLIFIGAAMIAGYAMLFLRYMKGSDTCVKNCHHINNIYGSICIMYSILSSILTILPAKYDPLLSEMCPLPDAEMQVIESFIPTMVKYIHLLRVGGTTNQDIPFLMMQQALDEATAITYSEGPEVVPWLFQQSAHGFSAEGQLWLIISLLRRYATNMKNGIWPKLRGDGIQELWQIGPFELYEVLYYNTGEKLVSTIQDEIEKQYTPMVAFAVIFMLIVLIFTVLSMIMINKEENILKFTLTNLLRCQPQIIFQNPHIMNVLSGNYSQKEDEDDQKLLKFHTEVANRLNDIIIVSNEADGKIVNVNKSFEEMFNLPENEVINTKVSEFFMNGRFTSKDKIEKVLGYQITLVYKDQKENVHYIEFTNQSVAGRKIFSGRDITQTLMHEKMISDEKKKSDAMLSSILPASLVPRVQAEEKNISFAVQSVTVLFLDVVEFTPWCGSHDAQYVMRMLNIMFKEFDAITNAHKTMTKIKCIGDCYMAAGGIFDEVNQPAVHAKEVVDFGCLVIKKLLEIDQQENENLRIRVGINTGGPIIAGVIGTEKPTFEILGPAINTAHEMEHHGVPMKVHISRPVYELIYGQQFDIKERGEIDIKGGKMFTYLVEP